MIPLVNIIDFINTLLCLVASIKFYASWRKTRNKDVLSFAGGFVGLGLYFGFVGVPGIFTSDPYIIQIFYTLSYPAVFLSVIIFFMAMARILHWPQIQKITPIPFFTILFLSTLINTLFFRPAVKYGNATFFYWDEGTPIWLQNLNGAFIFIVVGLGVAFFFFAALRVRKAYPALARRSFILGSGVFILLLATISNYFLSTIFLDVTLKVWATVVGAFFSFVALLIILIGLLGYSQEKTVS